MPDAPDAARAYSYILIPGRHHALTRFQATYFRELLDGGTPDLDGNPVACAPDAQLVWAVTSSNHQNTRRNPIPSHRREAAIELMSQRQGFNSLVVPVVDVAPTPRFADITLKSVTTATSERVHLTPENCIVATSTPAVIEMYRDLGFRIAPIELGHPAAPMRAWEVLLDVIDNPERWSENADPATLSVVERYGLDDVVKMVMSDPIVGDEGGLTTTRNYATYAASFENAAQRKWDLARAWIRPGRIVDIGCATGGMLELAGREPRLAESDLYGIEVARHLYEECLHRKAQGVFENPNTYFYQRNILSGAIFPARSVDTTMSFALTHEIFSYGDGMPALGRFASTIFEQTAPGGIWINSDVLGPDDGGRIVRLEFRDDGLGLPARDLSREDGNAIRTYLDTLSPAARFEQFAADFRAHSGVEFRYVMADERTVELRLSDAMEFLSHQRYTDNWMSETHEQFNALDWQAWRKLVTDCGFSVDPRSGPWQNSWLVDNTFEPVAALTDTSGARIAWPNTHVLLVAERPALELG